MIANMNLCSGWNEDMQREQLERLTAMHVSKDLHTDSPSKVNPPTLQDDIPHLKGLHEERMEVGPGFVVLSIELAKPTLMTPG